MSGKGGNQNKSVDTNWQDQHTEILDLVLSFKLDDLSLINPIVKDQRTFDIETTGFVPLVGHIVCLKDTDGTAFYQGEIITIVPIAGNQYTVTMDSLLDADFANTDGCSLRTGDLSTADGSVTPVEFTVSPVGLDPSVEWDITRMIVTIGGTSTMDNGLFGDQPALTRGVLFRHVNGVTKNIFNAKTNGDFKKHCYDVDFDSKAPAGQTAVSIRRSYSGVDKNGVTIRLTAKDFDRFVGLVQDDLTGNLSMSIIIQGHRVDS